VRQADAFLRGRGTSLEAATRADLEAFMADLLARRMASTAATTRSQILYGWLTEEEEIPTNPKATRRDTALLMLLLDTGARRAQMVGLARRRRSRLGRCCWCSRIDTAATPRSASTSVVTLSKRARNDIEATTM
jgi:site-specific recombinase XerD